jgi:hypothetical protein
MKKLLLVLLLLPLICDAAVYSLAGSDGTPTVSACGTSASVDGTDSGGIISTGTGVVLSCTLNFSATLSTVPYCVISTGASALTTGISSITASALTIGLSLTLTSGKIYYMCAIR